MSKHWDWQPIATAPKDGTEVILMMPFSSGHGVRIGSWSGKKIKAWRDQNGARLWCDPTYWTPLPELSVMIVPDQPISFPDQLRNLADLLRIAADELEAERADIRKARTQLALDQAHARSKSK